MHATAATLIISLLLLTARGTAAEMPALAAKEDQILAANNSSSSSTPHQVKNTSSASHPFHLKPDQDLLHAHEQPPESPSATRALEPGRRQEPVQEPPRADHNIDIVAPPYGTSGGPPTSDGPADSSHVSAQHAGWPAEQGRITLAKARSPAPPIMRAPRSLQEQGTGVDVNGEPDCGDSAAFAALSAGVMQSCCPSPAPGEEADTGNGECELPANCDTTECGDRFLEFFDACYSTLSALSDALFQQFDAFKTGCEASYPPMTRPGMIVATDQGKRTIESQQC